MKRGTMTDFSPINPKQLQFPQDVIVQRDQHAIIKVTGEDAVKYLQGQFTNDITLLTPDRTMRAAHCNFKGKMWAIFQLIPFSGGIYLVTTLSSLETTLRELKKFAVFSKVTIEHDTHLQYLSGSRQALMDILKTQGLATDDSSNVTQSHKESVTWYCERSGLTHVIVPDTVAFQSESESDSDWVNTAEVLAGLPQIVEQTADQFVPQMMNLQLIDGISFEKGCYTGQEVVARTKYLGKNKRATLLLQATSSVAVPAGTDLELSLGENWRRAGSVIRSSQFNGNTYLLAVLPNDTESDAIFRLKGNDELLFNLSPLPYSIN